MYGFKRRMLLTSRLFQALLPSSTIFQCLLQMLPSDFRAAQMRMPGRCRFLQSNKSTASASSRRFGYTIHPTRSSGSSPSRRCCPKPFRTRNLSQKSFPDLRFPMDQWARNGSDRGSFREQVCLGQTGPGCKKRWIPLLLQNDGCRQGGKVPSCRQEILKNTGWRPFDPTARTAQPSVGTEEELWWWNTIQ